MTGPEQWVNALYISSATVLALGVAAKALETQKPDRLDVRALARGGTIKRVK